MTLQLPVETVPREQRPGLATGRLVRLMRRCVTEMRIDLAGAVVLTEAATGPYAVTPVLAALAGADEVIGITGPSRHGTVAEVCDQTLELATAAGVADRVVVTTESAHTVIARADVVTNSGHLRPIDRHLVACMKPTAVLPLMFEAWEIQAGRVDLDLDGLLRRGIPVAGTNERHRLVDVFSYLPTMAVKLLLDAGTAVRGTRIALLCDNPFAPYLEHGLRAAGATVRLATSILEVEPGFEPDVVLVAMRPRGTPVIDPGQGAALAARWPDTITTQLWGDLDRALLDTLGVNYWPLEAPATGHMAVLPSDIGPEPVVRLQAGGLKVASVLRKPPHNRGTDDLEFLDPL
ncbi:MAG TPA: hypothetical protein VF468_28090 [Actinomycetota bacterium]|nr:hypothetical protein [Actinomycetota bacterium]